MNIRFRIIGCLLTSVIIGNPGTSASAQPCELGWDPSVGDHWFIELRPNGESPGTRAFAIFDDGTGPALYSGGGRNPSTDGAVTKWTGNSWEMVGGGLDDYPQAHVLLPWDDGTGVTLYAGGAFTTADGSTANAIARWDGSSWSALGSGLTDGPHDTICFALAEYDDGNGSALYAAGRCLTAGGVPVRHIAKWDGAEWSDVGGGMDGMVYLDRLNALAVYDDGHGPALYVGGMHGGAGGISSPGIVKWDGTSWSSVGGGVGGTDPTVRALRVFDDGNGAALYVGGTFNEAGGVSASRIAKWDGVTWSPLGDGLPAWVTSLEVFDDGTGPSLYAGGKFSESDAGGQPGMNYIAKWNGSSWEPLGNGTNHNVYFMEVFDDGRGSALYASGGFTAADGMTAHTIARWGCTPAFLALSIDLPSYCVEPGETLTVTLRMYKLGAFQASEFSAHLSFDDSLMSFVEGTYTAEPFGLHLIDPITADGGDIDVAAAIDELGGQTPTSDDADLVTLTFEALTESCATQVSFRFPTPESQLLDPNGVAPPYGLALLDSAAIPVDQTPPTLTYCPPDITVLLSPGETGVTLDPGVAEATDNCTVTLVGTRDDGQELTDPYPVHRLTVITWRAEDQCGHFAECKQSIAVGIEGRLHVDADAPPGGDGTSWATAINDLQDTLAMLDTESEVRVAEGVYRPDSGSGDRTAAFALPGGVSLRGGYAGWDQPDPDLRDVNLYQTVLSGDLDQNDLGTTGREENSYHVVTASGVDSTAVLDGFTIHGGNANDASPDDRGGGLYCDGADPTVIDCTFDQNSADYGGGVYNSSGAATLGRCVFSNNWALDSGGALYNHTGDPAIISCIFRSDTAGSGGGIYNADGGLSLSQCIFSAESATFTGGAVYNDSGSLDPVNCAFSANSADSGGGLYSASGALALANCVLWGNSDGDGVDEDAQVRAAGGSLVINYSCVQGWTGQLGGTGNFGTDPLLVAPDGPDETPGTEDDDLRLQSGSPCIDAADNDAVSDNDPVDLDGDCDVDERTPSDLDGNARFFDDPATEPDAGHGDKPIVDVGPYEFGSSPPLFDDCNANGHPDLCDIEQQTSFDVNGSGIPDECEDCPWAGNSGSYCTADIYPNDGDGVWEFLDDGDCIVDIDDLAQLLGNYGMTTGATRESGDIYPASGDGVVYLGDLAEFLSQYGDDCNGMAPM